ncbi:MAG: phosphotransferase family protein [Gemmataceae bacterium]
MLELTPDNAESYLRSRHWIDKEPAQIELLAGGVSNIVLRIVTPRRRMVLKQSRPQLRTRDAWFSDLNRVYREQEVMEFLHPLLPPTTVPAVLFCDRDDYVFVMEHAPADARVWKADLLAGTAEQASAAHAGCVLGRMHQASAAAPERMRAFQDRTVYGQLRVEPFYRRIQERLPDVADKVQPIIERMTSVSVALCHGDYTPKNILIHAQGFTLVDYETAHYGDPTMDLGLFLCHLLLKAARLPEYRHSYFDLVRSFWSAYVREVQFQPLTELAAYGIEHLGVCLLARIDGTSPVEYLPEEPKRAAVRRLGKSILRERPRQWDDVLIMAEGEFQGLI